jgi:hypothetical protein
VLASSYGRRVVRGVYTGEEDEENYDADLEGMYEGCEGAGIHVWCMGLEMECMQCGLGGWRGCVLAVFDSQYRCKSTDTSTMYYQSRCSLQKTLICAVSTRGFALPSMTSDISLPHSTHVLI